MGNLGSGNDHDLFGNAFINQNPIALAHGHSIFSFPLRIHAPKLSLPCRSGKSHFEPTAFG
jgi:hypothetical protein